MKNKILWIIQAIGIVCILILAFMLYLCIEVQPEVIRVPYEPFKPVILSDTTNTWPDPDSVYTFDDGLCEAHVYKKSTL